MKLTYRLNFLLIVLLLTPLKKVAAQSPIGKVVDSYIEGATTYMLIEVNRYLNTSQTVYLQGGIPIVIREIMSISEKEGINYYRAYSLEKLRVLAGESVFLEATTKAEKLRIFERKAIFMKKKHATVTLVEGSKALINRGSLHNVDKRDVYKIYGQNGTSKGEVELYGIGDFLSAGHIQYPLERKKRFGKIQESDSAVFIGNRKILGTGFFAILNRGADNPRAKISPGVEYSGGGALWSMILRRGRIIEVLLGPPKKVKAPDTDEYKRLVSRYPTSIWYRRTFYYPGWISPSTSLGISYFETTLETLEYKNVDNNGMIPIIGAGVEFFSGRMFHLRIDGFYYPSPELFFNGMDYKTDSLFLFWGWTLNW